MKRILFCITIVFSFILSSSAQVSAFSQNFHQDTFENIPSKTCSGIKMNIKYFFRDVGIAADSIQVDIYSRNWGNKTNRELTYLTTIWGGGEVLENDDMRNGGGGCLFDPNNVYIRATVSAPGYNTFNFDAPLIQPPARAQNDRFDIDVLLFNQGNWTGNVSLDSPADGITYTSNNFIDRGFWAVGPRDPADLGVIPSIGSFFDYGLRLVTGPGPDDYQWASPEVFYPSFHSGGNPGDPNPCPRHLSDNTPSQNPIPAVAFNPCAYPDASSHGTQMYKPGTNFTDTTPFDGLYKWNVTYGIGPWNGGGGSAMSAQQSYYAGHAISQADQTARTFRLLTDIRPIFISPNGATNPDGTYKVGQTMNFTTTVKNFSSGVAANTNTPVTFVLTNTTNGTTWSSNTTVVPFINPGLTQTAISGNWFSTSGNYRIDVCVNSPYTRLTVQGAPVCMTLFFVVGVPPPPTYTVSGEVWNDADKSKTINGAEGPLAGQTIYYKIMDASGVWGPQQSLVSASGFYTIPGVISQFQVWNALPNPSYEFTWPKNGFPSAGFQGYSGTVGVGCSINPTNPLTPLSPSCSSGNIVGANLGIRLIPRYTIKGSVIVDRLNPNGILELPQESPYTLGGLSVTYTGPLGSGNASVVGGAYTIPNLLEGTYDIGITGLPLGYFIAFPKFSPLYQVHVGEVIPCSILPNLLPGQCDTPTPGNISTLNIGVNNFIAWQQFSGFDMRFDTNYDTNVPDAPACDVANPYALTPGDPASKLLTTGISYVGPLSTFFGGVASYGKANAHAWVANESYGPKSLLKTSYATLLNDATNNGIVPAPLKGQTGCSLLSNCSLSSLSKGIYVVSAADGGDVTIIGTSINSKDIIILAQGTVTIKGAISVATDATLTVAADNDIVVDASVGSPPTSCPVAGHGDIQGYFSAGRNFTVNSVPGGCPATDQQLYIEGSITVNANRISNGRFINDRDLCADNNYPSVLIKKRLDFLVHAPEFLKKKSLDFREIAP